MSETESWRSRWGGELPPSELPSQSVPPVQLFSQIPRSQSLHLLFCHCSMSNLLAQSIDCINPSSRLRCIYQPLLIPATSALVQTTTVSHLDHNNILLTELLAFSPAPLQCIFPSSNYRHLSKNIIQLIPSFWVSNNSYKALLDPVPAPSLESHLMLFSGPTYLCTQGLQPFTPAEIFKPHSILKANIQLRRWVMG